MDNKYELIEELRGVITELLTVVGRQAERILELELAKAKKDSSIYSKPPSSDIVKPSTKKNPGIRRKRKWGRQLSHQEQLRQPLSLDRVNEAFEYKIDNEEVIARQLTPTDWFENIQHIELLQSPIHINETSIMHLPKS